MESRTNRKDGVEMNDEIDAEMLQRLIKTAYKIGYDRGRRSLRLSVPKLRQMIEVYSRGGKKMSDEAWNKIALQAMSDFTLVYGAELDYEVKK